MVKLSSLVRECKYLFAHFIFPGLLFLKCISACHEFRTPQRERWITKWRILTITPPRFPTTVVLSQIPLS